MINVTIKTNLMNAYAIFDSSTIAGKTDIVNIEFKMDSRQFDNVTLAELEWLDSALKPDMAQTISVTGTISFECIRDINEFIELNEGVYIIGMEVI